MTVYNKQSRLQFNNQTTMKQQQTAILFMVVSTTLSKDIYEVKGLRPGFMFTLRGFCVVVVVFVLSDPVVVACLLACLLVCLFLCLFVTVVVVVVVGFVLL